MDREFNLLWEPWIRVLKRDCSVTEVSMVELFTSAHQYLQLAGDMATQDIALLRILLAITLTVFYRYDWEGEEEAFSADDEKEDVILRWKDYWEEGKFNGKVFENYLKTYEERFWLFHPKTPFWQWPDLMYGTDYGIVSILGNVKESNNKATRHHFSMTEGEGMERLTYAEAARSPI